MLLQFKNNFEIQINFIFTLSVKRNYNPEKTVSQKDTCAPMFIAVLFTIAKTWKQPKCPSTEEWIKKMWYVYIKGLSPSHKNNEIKPFAATWMDLELIILSEVTHTEKEKYHRVQLICGI